MAKQGNDDWRCNTCHMFYSVAGDDKKGGKKWKACANEEKGCNVAWCPECINLLEISNHEANCGWKGSLGPRSKHEDIPPVLRKKRKTALYLWMRMTFMFSTIRTSQVVLT